MWPGPGQPGLKPKESVRRLTLFLESQSCTRHKQKMRQSGHLGLLCFCRSIICLLSVLTVTSVRTQPRHLLKNRFSAAFASAALDIDYDVVIDK